jgi:GlpG protein
MQAELAAFWKTPPIRAIWRPAGSPGRPTAVCTTSAFPFFATLRHNAGPFTWAFCWSASWSFPAKYHGDRPVMLLLAWPYDPSLKFEVWRYFSHAFMHFSLMHISSTCYGGGISAERWKTHRQRQAGGDYRHQRLVERLCAAPV